MKFAHISDSHLGGWRQPELQALNIESFKKAIEISIQENVEFILFTGDLFDSPFPPIDILKETFSEFRKLKDAGIKSFIIAGSHDYSVSGKTFLDVLEKSGFCEICKYEETETKVVLLPIMYKSFYIYGYPGKKSGLEIGSLKRIEINEPYSNYFRILMLHTTIKEAIENIPVESIPLNELPKADYYALGHVHIVFEKAINDKPAVYGGPTFPNNFKELEELKYGAFYIVDIEGYTKIIRKELKLKDVELIEIELDDALKGTEKILEILKRLDLKGRIVLLKVFGQLKKGKISDIKFQEIQEYLEKNGVYSFLKNISKLESGKKEFDINLQPNEMDKIEEILIKNYSINNPSHLNKQILPLLDVLNLEKQEGETSQIFESRLFSIINKLLNLSL